MIELFLLIFLVFVLIAVIFYWPLWHFYKRILKNE
jgi:hypothetical protein